MLQQLSTCCTPCVPLYVQVSEATRYSVRVVAINANGAQGAFCGLSGNAVVGELSCQAGRLPARAHSRRPLAQMNPIWASAGLAN